MRRLAFAALFLPCVLSAQAILQQSVAAGAGTAAGSILGKQLSNALDVVQAATKEAEGAQPTDHKKRDAWKRWATGDYQPFRFGAEKEITSPALANTVSGVTRAPYNGAAPVNRGAPAAKTRVSPERGGSAWIPSILGSARESRAVVNEPAPDLTTGDLSAISAGASREEVVEKLGTPVARVTIPENGRFLEVYYYQSRGETLGAVRLDGGEVTEVQLAR